MNGTQARPTRPPAAAITPPAPAAAPPAPPNQATTQPANRQTNGSATNGTHTNTTKGRKKPAEQPVDPSQMYETLKNRIAALEEEEVHEEEEERRFAEEAQDSVSGMEQTAIHSKYIELFAEFKRLERDHAKEKQKLVKDKDAAKSQLNKANQTKSKMENLARELQKDNKKLREDSKRLAACVEEAQEEIIQMKSDMAKRVERAKIQETKYRETPDIVVRVHCKYRAELYFKIPRKLKLARLFEAWTERMELGVGKKVGTPQSNGAAAATAATPSATSSSQSSSSMQFIFSHGGRCLEGDQSSEDAGIEDGDVILAAEIMDLTEGPGTEEIDEPEPRREKLKKEWAENPQEAKKTMEEIFDGVVRERLKELLRQYELRERHFECVIRSKELEVLLSRARAAEQKQLAEGEKLRADKLEEEVRRLRINLEENSAQQTSLIEKIVACCDDSNDEALKFISTKMRENLEARMRNANINRPPEPGVN